MVGTATGAGAEPSAEAGAGVDTGTGTGVGVCVGVGVEAGSEASHAGLFSAREVGAAVYAAVARFMLAPATGEQALGLGYGSPQEYYVAGRGGVLGDTDAATVFAAFGFFAADWVRPRWEKALAVRTPRESARRYGAACAAWGRTAWSPTAQARTALARTASGADGPAPMPTADLSLLVEYVEAVVQTADATALPLFAAWRAEPLAADLPGKAMQLLHQLREWRGGLHLLAARAVGLSARDAVLADGGPQHCTGHGWPTTQEADTDTVRRRAEALSLTDRWCDAHYAAALTPTQRTDFSRLVRTYVAPLGEADATHQPVREKGL